jgi:hypothetical protein
MRTRRDSTGSPSATKAETREPARPVIHQLRIKRNGCAARIVATARSEYRARHAVALRSVTVPRPRRPIPGTAYRGPSKRTTLQLPRSSLLVPRSYLRFRSLSRPSHSASAAHRMRAARRWLESPFTRFRALHSSAVALQPRARSLASRRRRPSQPPAPSALFQDVPPTL